MPGGFHVKTNLEPQLGGSDPRTWRAVVNNHGDRFCPLTRVVGPLPNGLKKWLINGGDPFTTYDTWGDPPKRPTTLKRMDGFWDFPGKLVAVNFHQLYP